jgi:hypothetical protein
MNDYPPEYDRDERDNSVVEAAFADYAGPGDLYRATYKYTPCGPSVGVCIQYVEVIEPDGFTEYPSEVERSKWIYCDDLYQLGKWADMASRGELITALCVSSIVEGMEQTTGTIEVSCDPDHLALQATPEEGDDLHKTLERLFSRAVDLTDAEANEIWDATHGCETCAAHWRDEGIAEGMYGPMEGCDGATYVWKDCPDCEGHGVVI